MKVIVIGAGLGGLTLAHGLRRAGIDVAVYERDAASGRPQGVSLHLDERGRSALRACLPPAHFAMVEATTGGPREQTLKLSDVDGELAVTGVQPSLARPGRQVHRPLLRAVLLTDLDDVVSFGAVLVGAAEIEDYVMWALPATREPAMELPPALRTAVDEAWPDVAVALRIGSIPPRDALAEAHRGRLGLLDAIGGYEDTMRHNGFAKASA
ncbi:FAD-dependent oxidoreductase [Amycolatopsis japonica]|uniref:FAD-dependent oxidoreductase n=1 Tax=Amycolatopsis japonica TaxID=208439 RepID=UPI0037F567EE